MPAILEFLASDDSTVITTDNEGAIPSPGSCAATKYFVKNVGDVDCTSLVLSIEQVGANDGALFALLAPDVSGAPGTFGIADINVGTLAVGSSQAFWARSTLTAGLTPNNNLRRWNIHAEGNTL